MKKILFLTNIVLFSCFVWAQGDLQIYCESGVKILINQKYVGTTDAKYSGLYIENISVGNIEITAIKKGYKEVKITKKIEDRKTASVTIKFTEKAVETENISNGNFVEIGNKTSSVEVRTVPVGAKLFLNSESKGNIKTGILVKNLSENEYEFKYVMNNQKMIHKLKIDANKKYFIKANFIDKNISIAEEPDDIKKEELKINYCQPEIAKYYTFYWTYEDKKDGKYSVSYNLLYPDNTYHLLKVNSSWREEKKGEWPLYCFTNCDVKFQIYLDNNLVREKTVSLIDPWEGSRPTFFIDAFLIEYYQINLFAGIFNQSSFTYSYKQWTSTYSNNNREVEVQIYPLTDKFLSYYTKTYTIDIK